jgi:hypothetical protein
MVWGAGRMAGLRREGGFGLSENIKREVRNRFDHAGIALISARGDRVTAQWNLQTKHGCSYREKMLD